MRCTSTQWLLRLEAVVAVVRETQRNVETTWEDVGILGHALSRDDVPNIPPPFGPSNDLLLHTFSCFQLATSFWKTSMENNNSIERVFIHKSVKLFIHLADIHYRIKKYKLLFE